MDKEVKTNQDNNTVINAMAELLVVLEDIRDILETIPTQEDLLKISSRIAKQIVRHSQEAQYKSMPDFDDYVKGLEEIIK